MTIFRLKLFLQLALVCGLTSIHADELVCETQLKLMYENNATTPSDINEHLPVLCELAKECSSVTAIGIKNMVSVWGMLEGLSQGSSTKRTFVGYDTYAPPMDVVVQAETLTSALGIGFNIVQTPYMAIQIKPCDMLFIDSLHTYCHLTHELETFSPKVNKYIALHDTSAPWGNQEDSAYSGDYTEYPKEYSRKKKGLWPAVKDFLAAHPEWQLRTRYTNNHGLTVLERVSK